MQSDRKKHVIAQLCSQLNSKLSITLSRLNLFHQHKLSVTHSHNLKLYKHFLNLSTLLHNHNKSHQSAAFHRIKSLNQRILTKTTNLLSKRSSNHSKMPKRAFEMLKRNKESEELRKCLFGEKMRTKGERIGRVVERVLMRIVREGFEKIIRRGDRVERLRVVAGNGLREAVGMVVRRRLGLAWRGLKEGILIEECRQVGRLGQRRVAAGTVCQFMRRIVIQKFREGFERIIEICQEERIKRAIQGKNQQIADVQSEMSRLKIQTARDTFAQNISRIVQKCRSNAKMVAFQLLNRASQSRLLLQVKQSHQEVGVAIGHLHSIKILALIVAQHQKQAQTMVWVNFKGVSDSNRRKGQLKLGLFIRLAFCQQVLIRQTLNKLRYQNSFFNISKACHTINSVFTSKTAAYSHILMSQLRISRQHWKNNVRLASLKLNYAILGKCRVTFIKLKGDEQKIRRKLEHQNLCQGLGMLNRSLHSKVLDYKQTFFRSVVT